MPSLVLGPVPCGHLQLEMQEQGILELELQEWWVLASLSIA
jgi:hypothetical protein